MQSCAPLLADISVSLAFSKRELRMLDRPFVVQHTTVLKGAPSDLTV